MGVRHDEESAIRWRVVAVGRASRGVGLCRATCGGGGLLRRLSPIRTLVAVGEVDEVDSEAALAARRKKAVQGSARMHQLQAQGSGRARCGAWVDRSVR